MPPKKYKRSESGRAGEVEEKHLTDDVRHELSLARRDKEVEEDREEEKQRGTRGFDLKIFIRLFAWTQPYRAKRNRLFVLVCVRSMQIPALAWAIGMVINGPIAEGNVPGIYWGAAGFGLLSLFTQITMHFRQRYALELGESVVFDMRNAVFQHLMRMPLSYYHRTKLGSIISRITSDIEALRVGVQNVLFVSLVQAGQMLGAGTLMVYYNWKLFLVIVAMTPALFFINRYFSKRISLASRMLQESFSRVTATVAESVKGIQVTQGFAREDRNSSLFRELIKDHSGYNMGLARNIALYLPLLELNSQLFIAAIVIIGGYGALAPTVAMPVGDLVTFFFLANLFFSPIPSLGRMFTSALSAIAGAERIFRLLDTPPDWSDDPDATAIGPITGKVEFRKLHFSYEPGKPVLKGIDVTAEAGQTIALVGHTGSGKSTIINLLCKYYLPTGGELLIDGRDVRSIRTTSLRDQIGIVLQNNFLFSGTVRENIRLGKIGASDADVEEAVRRIDCLDLVEAMLDGFDTVITEKGAGLSLGQRQVVCFARAMLADPCILILDEATASVDTVTEARLQKALETLMQGRTSFVVAHRLSTIRRADRVLVLNQGEIAERGSHVELLKQDGIYASLYRQFAEG
ncbi:MAG: ABC transporter ATP-binding protein [Kiritimatiellae bacterium]|jgi:ATP-binding cassette subfamily B protein|nr:ABC transporter ATP-binding protein [Kiritimatiellia bacterium]